MTWPHKMRRNFYWEKENNQIGKILEARNRTKTKLAIYYINDEGRLTAVK